MWHGSVLIIMLPSHNIWFYIFNGFVLKKMFLGIIVLLNYTRSFSLRSKREFVTF